MNRVSFRRFEGHVDGGVFPAASAKDGLLQAVDFLPR
jgi:hypothetical protein